MNPRDLDTVRALVSSLMGTLAALDQILNGANEEPEPQPDIQPGKQQPRYFGDDETPAA